MDIVEQDDSAAARAADRASADDLAVAVGPVTRIDRPQNR